MLIVLPLSVIPEESIVNVLPLASSSLIPLESMVTVLLFESANFIPFESRVITFELLSVRTTLPAWSSKTTLCPLEVLKTFWSGVADSGTSPSPHHVPHQIG